MNDEILNGFVEVKLPDPQAFLKVKETLTRIGVASKKDKTLYQSCHILHKQGKYYLVHFKEMFMLDGKPTDFTEEDCGRRNTIANLLSEWSLITLVDSEKSSNPLTPLNRIKIISYGVKGEWNLVAKYSLGKKRYTDEQ
jgi:Bacteriophage translational regulator